MALDLLRLSIALSLIVLAKSSPVRLTEAQKDTSTESARLLPLPDSRDFISLADKNTLKSGESSRITTPSSTYSPDHVTLSGSGDSVQEVVTESQYSRGIRSVTLGESRATEETTAEPVTDERTAVTEVTTAISPVTEQTTLVVNLDQEQLDNASKALRKLWAAVQEEMYNLGISLEMDLSWLVDVNSRPMLPDNISENALMCVQIQPMLRAVHEVLQDFMGHADYVTFYTNSSSVKTHLSNTDRQISKMLSPPYEYTSTVAPGTDSKNKLEVITTLYTLHIQCGILDGVLFLLMPC